MGAKRPIIHQAIMIDGCGCQSSVLSTKRKGLSEPPGIRSAGVRWGRLITIPLKHRDSTQCYHRLHHFRWWSRSRSLLAKHPTRNSQRAKGSSFEASSWAFPGFTDPRMLRIEHSISLPVLSRGQLTSWCRCWTNQDLWWHQTKLRKITISTVRYSQSLRFMKN